MLWKHWWELVCELRSACARTRTFLWMALCLAGMTTRKDLLGVTSIVRALGLEPACYDRLLDFFHSPALDLDKLTRAWCALVFRAHPGILRVNGRPVLVGDGIKVAKAGRKMPAVKKLHQQSESNTKPEYIFGHSCQAVAVLTQALSSVFALPLACRIHEGVVFSNRDQRTLLDEISEFAGKDEEKMKTKVMEVLRHHFKPEFLNRLDDIIIFHSLDRDQIKQIVDIQIGRLNKRLAERKLTVVLDNSARQMLANEGFDPAFGARPLKRAIQRLVENPLALEILAGKFLPGETIEATADGDHLRFVKK